MKTAIYILLAIAVSLSVTAQADPIQMCVEYELGNNPDGGARPTLYGLRLDGLTTGDSSDIYTFDFESNGAYMTMIWNVDETLNIGGTAYGGLNEKGATQPAQQCSGPSTSSTIRWVPVAMAADTVPAPVQERSRLPLAAMILRQYQVATPMHFNWITIAVDSTV